MLVLSRRVNEVIAIGPEIRVTVAEIKAKSVRLAIDAPYGLRVWRPGETGPELPTVEVEIETDPDSLNTECRESVSKDRERRLKSNE